MRHPAIRALAVLLVVAAVGVATLRWLRTPEVADNIVILLVDTLRADHLGAYGYDRDTSPTIDTLASHGTVFETAYSVSNWTTPAIKSIFTGRSPQALMHDAKHGEASRVPLPTELTTFT